MKSQYCVKTEFFQDGCQTAQAMTPIINKIRASPPLHTLCENLVEIRQAVLKIERPQTLKKRERKTDAAQNNTFLKRYFRAVKNRRSAQQYLPEKIFPGGNKILVRQTHGLYRLP